MLKKWQIKTEEDIKEIRHQELLNKAIWFNIAMNGRRSGTNMYNPYNPTGQGLLYNTRPKYTQFIRNKKFKEESISNGRDTITQKFPILMKIGTDSNGNDILSETYHIKLKQIKHY